MSSEKTPNLQLHKWQASDYVLRTEFNDNFAKIDDHAKQVTEQLADIAINVKSFGAKGDGVTDDTQAFLDAISQITTRGQFIIPSGTFLINTDTVLSLPSDCTVLCFGTIKFPSTRTNVLFNIVNKKNITLQGLRIDGCVTDPTTSYSDTCHAISIKSGKNIKVIHCDIRNVTGDGVYIGRDYTLNPVAHSENIEIIHNTLHNCKRQSVVVVDGVNIKVRFNQITSDYGTGYWNKSGVLDIEPNNTDEAVQDIYFEWNYIDGSAGEDGKSILLGTSVGSGKTPSQFRDIYFRYNTIVCRTNPTVAVLFDGGNGAINGVCEGNKILGACETGIQAYEFLKNLYIIRNFIESSSNNGIIFSYNGSNVFVKENDITITEGRGIQSYNNNGNKYEIMNNDVKGSTTSAEAFMINGSDAVNDVLVAYNRVSATGSAYGLRVHQTTKARVVHNDAVKLTTTNNTDLLQSMNTIEGNFPKQSGTTADRPTKVDPNHIFWDITLEKPIIYYNGWKDFAGASV